MKKIYFLGLTISLLLSSCVNVNEKIYIKNDGSGTYQLDMDMNGIIEMMQSIDKHQGDSLQDAMVEQAKENSDYSNNPGITNAKNSFDKSSNVYSTTYNFSNLSALNLSWNSSKESEDDDEEDISQMLQKNNFKKLIGAKKKFSMNLNLKELRAGMQESSEELEMAKMFMEDNTYSIEFRFERKVKSFKGLYMSKGSDDNTVIFSIPFEELLFGTKNEKIPISIKLK